MDSVLLIKALIVLGIFVVSLTIAAYETYFERVVAGYIQDRVGPDRAGPFGLLQPLADGGKLFFKEEFIPSMADKWLFILGPSLAMITALMTSAVIPFGDSIIFDGQEIQFQVIEVNIGILWVFGVVSLGVYGILIGGWASNNKYSLYGAIRAASQNISYELAMGLSIIAILMMSESLSLRTIVENQHGMNWNVFYQPLGFLLFLVCSFAECNRTPFDLPESENELVAGYHTEFSSMKLGLYLFSEYINMFISSAVIATLYFGGFNYPGMDWVYTLLTEKMGAVVGHNLATLVGTLAFFAKIFFFIFLYMWVRWTLPRFRYDQLMDLGWKGLIPLAIVNLIITAAAELSGKALLVNWIGLAVFIALLYLGSAIFNSKKTSV
ncbi:NADH-quinone oxidoreductase subunit NuoH [Jiulongibacter sp. NS-SX5]|uniref:NADH-quinone oxidoreductase subunit NuoH n=1 Tax=Jiulongibacter sp. NS-SX5 TaxID=3463854 RepID=UPI004058A01C